MQSKFETEVAGAPIRHRCNHRAGTESWCSASRENLLITNEIFNMPTGPSRLKFAAHTVGEDEGMTLSTEDTGSWNEETE